MARTKANKGERNSNGKSGSRQARRAPVKRRKMTQPKSKAKSDTDEAADELKMKRHREKVAKDIGKRIFDPAFDWYVMHRDPYLKFFPKDHPEFDGTMETYLASNGYTPDTLLECLYDSNGACPTPLDVECQNILWAYLRNNRGKYGFPKSDNMKGGTSDKSSSSLHKTFSAFSDITVSGQIDENSAQKYSEKFAYDIVAFQALTSHTISKWDHYVLHSASGLTEPKQRYLKSGAILTCSKFKEDQLKDIVDAIKEDGDQRAFEIRFKQACDKRMIAFLKNEKSRVKKGYEKILATLKNAFHNYIVHHSKPKPKKSVRNGGR